MIRVKYLCFIFLLVAGIQSASGFALLGPFAPWMVAPLAYRVPDAIGGPMKIGDGYRWNVPVITYGYDKSFVDYFGTNGIAAVESAIKILNDLPPASQIDFSTYPLDSKRVNYVAMNQNLLDLKSMALPMLEEQLGLAQPAVSTFCLTSFSYNPSNFVCTYDVETRNYDPTSLLPTNGVNGTVYDYDVSLRLSNTFVLFANGSGTPGFVGYGELNEPVGDASTGVFTDDPQFEASAIADCEMGSEVFQYLPGLYPGLYFNSLTYDDAGGLAFQLSTNNIAMENLILGVHGYGTNANNFVNKALRPGMDKITFQRMNLAGGGQTNFVTITNRYIDSFITNGVLHQQTLERIVSRPDILFTANYIGMKAVSCTGTTNWVNNGLPSNDGPGVIQPPIMINFNRLGQSLDSYSSLYPSPYGPDPGFISVWASFDGTTNSPVVYPVNPPTDHTEFHFFLNPSPYPYFTATYSWNIYGPLNALFSLQTSIDLTNWINIGTITNLGGTFTYLDSIYTDTPQRFFRTVRQYPTFFNGQVATSSNTFFLQFTNGNVFGNYSLTNFPYVNHADLGLEYFIDANDAQGDAYFYDFASGHFWYTSPQLFPYLYDFSLNAWLYYYPSTTAGHYSSHPRDFYNFATVTIITL